MTVARGRRPVAEPARDTDADWRRIAEDEPHWGVLTNPQFRKAELDEAALEAFHASGRSDVQGFCEAIARVTGRPPGGAALDFGCGVGRLTELMAQIAETAVGFDIAPGMLAAARARGGRASYVDRLPDGPFDWINSYIVFQHIPQSRGLALLDDLLGRLAPGGAVSLHFTVDRVGERVPEPPPGPRPFWRKAFWRPPPAPAPAGCVSMYDYDLNGLLERFRRGGVDHLGLQMTDHSGHIGYMIVGRRTAG